MILNEFPCTSLLNDKAGKVRGFFSFIKKKEIKDKFEGTSSSLCLLQEFPEECPWQMVRSLHPNVPWRGAPYGEAAHLPQHPALSLLFSPKDPLGLFSQAGESAGHVCSQHPQSEGARA